MWSTKVCVTSRQEVVQAEAVKQNFKKKKEPENMKKITDAIWKRKIFTAKTK